MTNANINIVNPFFYAADGTRVSSFSFDSSTVYTADMQKKLAATDDDTDSATVIAAIPFNGIITGMELRNTVGNVLAVTSTIVTASTPFKCGTNRKRLYNKICYLIFKISPYYFWTHNTDGTAKSYKVFSGFGIDFSTLDWENQTRTNKITSWEFNIPDEAVGSNLQEILFRFEPLGEDGEDAEFEAIDRIFTNPISRSLEEIGYSADDIFIEPEATCIENVTPEETEVVYKKFSSIIDELN